MARLIDADIAIKMISDEMITDAKALDIFSNLGDIDKVETLNRACERHIHMIEQLPPVETVKHGHWELSPFDGNWACSNCGNKPYHYNMENMNYCPNCGAYMGVEE